MKKSRLILPDTIKGLAVILMIQVHIMELFAEQEISNSQIGHISLFLGGIPAAPIFMFMMGYLMAFKNKSSIDMLKRGVRLFLGGIILNIGLNFHLIYNIIYKDWNYNLWSYVLGADILTLAGLSLIIFVVIHKLAKESYLIYFGIALILATISKFFTPLLFEVSEWKYVLSFVTGGTSWSYFPLIPWLAYPVLGFGLKLLTNKYSFILIINSLWSKIAVTLITLILILTFNYGFSKSYSLPDYYHHHLLFFLWSIGFMAVWFYVWHYITEFFKDTQLFKFLQFLGKNVTFIYVIQWLIIGNLGTEIYKSKDLGQSIMWFFIVLLVSPLLVYFFNLVKAYLLSIKKFNRN